LERRLRVALASGADLLDIGGQSTRPGAEIVSIDEEIRRIVPAIELARRLSNKPISVDTFKPAVARAALTAGATIVNDVRGCADLRMIALIRDADARVASSCILVEHRRL
jgi:dihydropteroate synthase